MQEMITTLKWLDSVVIIYSFFFLLLLLCSAEMYLLFLFTCQSSFVVCRPGRTRNNLKERRRRRRIFWMFFQFNLVQGPYHWVVVEVDCIPRRALGQLRRKCCPYRLLNRKKMGIGTTERTRWLHKSTVLQIDGSESWLFGLFFL